MSSSGSASSPRCCRPSLVVPAFALAYLIAAPTPLRKRIVHLLAAGAAMVLSAGWWIAIVELVPASARPYIGGSQSNSILELTLGYNGLGRITGNEVGSVGGGGGGNTAGSMWGATGLTRMFNAEIGGQISWLIPSALILLVVGLWARGRMPRTDTRRAAYIVWGGWLLITGLTFSLMAGIFHAYYTIALAPAIGALVGMGGKEAWERRHGSLGSIALAAATAAAAVWSFILLSRTPDWFPWLRFGVLIVGMAAAFLLLVVVRLHRRAVPLVLAAAMVAGLAGPAAYTLSTVATPHTGSIPTAGPVRPGRDGTHGRPRRLPGRRADRCRPRRYGAGRHGAGRHADRCSRWRRHGRPAGRQHAEHRGGGRAQRRLRELHLGGRGDRLAERRRAAARDRAAGHGHRRLQRQRPLTDAGAVPGAA